MKRRLLIACADGELRQRTALALPGDVHELDTVACGLDAADCIRGARPDLLLIGGSLPDMRAQDLVALLEQRGGCPPFVVFSRVDRAEPAADWIRRGALDYLVIQADWPRPLAEQLDQLLARADSVRQLLAARHQRNQIRQQEQRLLDALPALALLVTREGTVLAASGVAQRLGLRPGPLPAEAVAGWRPPAGLFGNGGPLHREQDWQGQLFEARWTNLDEDRALCLALDPGPRRQEERVRRRLEGRRHLEQRMESLAELAGHLGHDISNQLLVVTGYTDMLLQQLPAEAPERSWIQGMRKAAENAGGLIRRLLAFTRMRGAVFAPLDLHRLLREISVDLRRIHPGIELSLDLQARPSMIRGDRERLREAILNLCANGCEAMADGGLLSIRSLSPPAAGGGAPTHLQLIVRDSGSGMDEGTVERIFDPFFTTRKAQGGAGLGLSYTWGCIRSHRGSIDVHSRPGHGSEFRVLLPLGDTGDETVAPPGGHILLVDDDEVVRAVVQSLLRAAGCRVSGFADGLAALDWFAGEHAPVDLALLDLRMPHMNGWELLGNLQARDPNLRALIMTGWSEDIDAGQLSRGHVLGLLHKPFQLEELQAAVQTALGAVARERAGER
jgi:signal transduction histidine kinase/ActR/RegA family two-component response regulator